jgi:hypothetical protein
MTENLQETTRAQRDEFIAAEKVRSNEIQKYVAAAIDRLSTAVAVVGFLGPIVSMANSEIDHRSSFYIVQSTIMTSSVVLSYGLHLW